MKNKSEIRRKPDYGRIYGDLLRMKYPDRIEEFRMDLSKEDFTALDVIALNDKIFSKIEDIATGVDNQKLKSYNKATIFQILDYQKKHGLNNSELARHFKMSRNTVGKWKKLFY